VFRYIPEQRIAEGDKVDKTTNGPILVMGAGTIGCYLGGCLQASGTRVVFVGRPRVLAALREHGLTLTDLDHRRQHLPADALELHETVPTGIEPSFVILAV
jgi:2-dehydropantoate 2-reductase